MTSNDTFDEVPEPAATGLTLPRLTPDPARAARVRAQCRAQLARQQERRSRAFERARLVRGVLAPALAGAFCVLYVGVLVATTLHLYGVFP